MDHQHHLKTLAQRDNGYIGYCAGCQSYNVAYKNSLFILAEAEFACYRDVMTDRTAMRPFFTTHGKEWLLKTPMQNYFIMLSDEEIEELVQMMDEATVLMEVDQILNITHRLG
ncbi:DUF6686 family protein [Spirosoma validum]|uniref:Uncharacterized protein n=1 Tax=Spirosoma validum TaxID=2771355 RepID=A0A927GCG7_9BACT|nr:DUF6686 family protein [Spirosoma validum]MBD2752649.1 hypothetical protein [Spirosoma validum]